MLTARFPLISVAIADSFYGIEIGALNMVTDPRAVIAKAFITNVDVAAVPTSPSIRKVAAEPEYPTPTVCIRAHPAVPDVAAVPVNPAVAESPSVPFVHPTVPPQPIFTIEHRSVPDVP
jgi:hypothetical protein